jgi:ELWxxDGT repeat protein
MEKLLFVASDGSSGYEYWLTDGTEGGTQRLANIGSGSSDGAPVSVDATTGRATFEGDIAQLPGLFFFTAENGEGLELWVSDGTADGTRALDVPYPGAGSGEVTDVQTAAGQVFFYAESPDIGTELWATDGTEEGTRLVVDLWSGSRSAFATQQSTLSRLEAFNGGVVFVANDGTTGPELWFSNGTEAGTRLVADVRPNEFVLSQQNGSNPQGIDGDGSNIAGNLLFFSADDGESGRELWVTDGTEGGTRLVRDIATGSAPSNPRDFTAVGELMYFTAETGSSGRELWVSDGTAGGTRLAEDLRPGPQSSDPIDLLAFGGTLVFSAINGNTGREAWIIAEPGEDPELLRDIAPGNPASRAGGFGAGEGFFVFSANDGEIGTELYVSDGSPAGTELVDDIDPGIGSASPLDGFNFDGRVYFSAEGSSRGRELYVTDGTAEGTERFADIAIGAASSNPIPLAVVLDPDFDPGSGTVNLVPENLALSADAIGETAAPGTAVGTLSATDPDGDPVSFTLADDAGGLFALDEAGTGLVVAGPLDFEASGGSYTVTVEASDGRGGIVEESFAIAVLDGNDAPTVALSATIISDGATAGTPVGELTADDPNGDAVTLTLADDAGGTFELADDGRLLIAAPIDIEAQDSYEIVIAADDGKGAVVEQAIGIVVVGDNAPPEGIDLTGGIVPEDALPGTQAGILAASDADGDAVSFRLADDSDGRFAIGEDGVSVVVAGRLDFESTGGGYTVTVEAADGRGGFASRDLDITVTDANDLPELSLSGATLAPGAAAGVIVGEITAEDPNGDPVTLSLAEGAELPFLLDETDRLIFSGGVQLAEGQTFEIPVEADDGSDTPIVETFTVTVSGSSSAPGAIGIDGTAVREDAATGAVVGLLRAEDPDGDPVAFRIASPADAPFAIDGNSLVVSGLLDFETVDSYELEIEADDGRGGVTTGTVEVTVQDVDEAPDGLTVRRVVAETEPVETVLFSVFAEDPEGDPVSYALLDDDDGRFRITEAGDVVLARPLDYEEAAVHSLTVVVTSGAGQAQTGEDGEALLTQNLRIEVADRPEVIEFADDGTPRTNTADVDETFMGSDGADTLVYALARADVEDSVQEDGSVILSSSGGETDTLVGIERVALEDGVLRFDLPDGDGDLGFAYRLYKAAVARDPDEGGFEFWLGQLSSGALTREGLAAAFTDSPEFETLFAVGQSDEAFIEAYYENILERPADPGGRTFWVQSFQDGADRADLLIAFAESGEFVEANADNYDDGVFLT